METKAKANESIDKLFKYCPVCNNDCLIETTIALPEGPMLECPSCGHYLSSCTHEQHQNSLWKWDSARGTNPDQKSLSRWRKVCARRISAAKNLLKTGSNQPHLLDVGCSSGSLLSVASDMGFTVSGVEPATAAAEAATKAGYNVFPGYLQDAAYPNNSFDVITLFEIVEHLGDPVALLEECVRVLKPGGVLVVNTPNAASWTAKYMKERWEGFSLIGLGGHASFFTPKSTESLAQRCGLRIVRIETRNVRFYERGQCHPLTFRLAKIAAQLLAFPARFFGKGHDLLVFLHKDIT